MNNQLKWYILLLFTPLLTFASGGSLSFAPPASDYSVVFLADVFGVVDGVLNGTGSQIMGKMFGVFNAAVLALGGIVIMYTLIVSTVNTAHEGQMLGQKWSSIWVPFRATLGLALLIPKASGYCVMQIFVMWVCVQGVGAADKIWNAALSYLNRGGVIVQAQVNPMDTVTGTGGNTSLFKGGGVILSGQTCMIGLQQVLTKLLAGYQNMLANDSGPCSGTPSPTMQAFCTSTIPDFLSSVNAVELQQANPDQTTPYKLPMPNFPQGSIFTDLNGICGTISWNPYSYSNATAVANYQSSGIQLTQSELEATKMSRAIAIQAMYQDLSQIAQIAINNNPVLFPPANSSSTTVTNSTPYAHDQFGVPYLSTGTPCTTATSTANVNCVTWGKDTSNSSDNSTPIFNGTEFQYALSDYLAVMAPTINLAMQSLEGSAATTQRNFITNAMNQGWIMAGSYFFDLVQLNSNNPAGQSATISTTKGIGRTTTVESTGHSATTDTDSGLDASVFDPSALTSPFLTPTGCQDPYMDLCVWMMNDSKPLNTIISLIDGEGVINPVLQPSNFNASTQAAIKGPGSSTMYGFINNSVMVQLPGQPGLVAPQFSMNFSIGNNFNGFRLPRIDFPCENVTITFFNFCLGSDIGQIIYNVIIVTLWNTFINLFVMVINVILFVFISIPLLGMSIIFKVGVTFIQQPTVNPIVALSMMGVNYINFANNLWIFLLDMAILSIIIPFFGLFVIPLLALTMPMLLAWSGVMLGIGFINAYYVPMLPYMIFTFGSLAWLMAVIEAMVAAPIVALGITHPEGEGPFGKGEQAIMILMNVFLRPSMMIIGYIAGISVSYVAVWIINSGFSNVITYITGEGDQIFSIGGYDPSDPSSMITTGYTGWAGIYGFFFSILIYTIMYMIVVQKSFTLIATLPDKVLRWIGGSPEQIGQESASWGDEMKGEVKEAGAASYKATAQVEQQIGGKAMGAIKKFTGASPDASSTGSAVE